MQQDVGQQANAGQDPSFAWLVSWLVLIALCAVLNRTRAGHAILYYALALMLLFLIVVEYRFIASVAANVFLPHDSGPHAGGH